MTSKRKLHKNFTDNLCIAQNTFGVDTRQSITLSKVHFPYKQHRLLNRTSLNGDIKENFLVPELEMSRQTATALPTGTSKCPPSQRVPTLSGTTASNSDLASLFECPVCFDYVLPPILQCQSGHLVRHLVASPLVPST